MARLPGLTSIREDQPQPGSRVRRSTPQEIPNIAAPGLRPQAAPVETYSRPAMPQPDSELDGLAEGLAAFSPALARFSSRYQAVHEEDLDAYASARRAEAESPEEWAQITETDPKLKGALGKAAAQRVSGMQNAALALEDIQNAYVNEFDKTSGNFEAFVAERVKPFLGDRINDPSYVKSFMDSLDPGLRQIRSGYAGYKATEQYLSNQQTFSDAFMSIARNGAAKGATSEDTAKAIFAEFYGNQKLMGMGYQDQAKAVSALAAKLAEEGNYDLVNALASVDRTGPDGKSMGKLLDDNLVGGDMAKAVLRAKSIRDDKAQEATITDRQSIYDRADRGELTDADIAALRDKAKTDPGAFPEGWVEARVGENNAAKNRLKAAAEKAAKESTYAQQEASRSNIGVEAVKGGKLYTLGPQVVIDKEGNEKTLSGDEVRQRAVDDYATWSAGVAKATGETWEQTIERELPVYNRNGVPPKDWVDLMSRGVNALSSPATLGDGVQESTQRAYTLYKRLRTNRSQLLRDLLPKEKAEVFETARISEEELGMAPEKALMDAVAQNADPTGKANPATRVSLDAVRKAADTGGIWNSVKGMFGGGVDTLNEPALVGAILRRAEIYAGRGLNADAAIERAAERVRDTFVNVNGWWIDASDRRIPPGFPALATEMINEYVEKHGKEEGFEARDLTITTPGNGGNAWIIVDKRTGAPVDHREDAVFDTSDLMVAEENRKAEWDRMRAEEAKTNAQRAYEPWVQIGNPDGPVDLHLGPFLPKNWKDPAVQEKLREGRRQKAEKQRQLLDAVGTAVVQGVATAAHAVQQGATDAVAPVLGAIKERQDNRRRESERWKASRQGTDAETPNSDAAALDEGIAATERDLRDLRGQLAEAKKKLIPRAIEMLKNGVPPGKVTEFLRKNGIGEDVWPTSP